MTLDPLVSALSALGSEVRAAAASVEVDRPGCLWLLLAPTALLVLRWFAAKRRRGRLAAVGLSQADFAERRAARWIHAAVFALAWLALAVGAAGPRWGDGGEGEGVAVGRDVVLAIDFSRSMSADDTANGGPRWRNAVAGANDLLDYLKVRGGHRVGLIAFAARAKLLVPLTTDFDHVASVLSELDGANLPPELRPADDAAASGTRIGAALAAAVDAHDERFPGFRDIILLTDGDDPANDREWAKGVSAARAAGIPVHAVGVGDPARDSPIDVEGQPLEFADADGVRDWVRTRLREDVLTALAVEGHGNYLPARRDVPALGEFFRDAVEPNPYRELSDGARPRPKDRSGWFLAAAAALFVLGWWRHS